MTTPTPGSPMPSAHPRCAFCCSDQIIPAGWIDGVCVAEMCFACGAKRPLVPPPSTPLSGADEVRKRIRPTTDQAIGEALAIAGELRAPLSGEERPTPLCVKCGKEPDTDLHRYPGMGHPFEAEPITDADVERIWNDREPPAASSEGAVGLSAHAALPTERPLFVGTGDYAVRCEMCGRTFRRASAAHARMHMEWEHSVTPSSGPKLIVHERATADRYEYVLAPPSAPPSAPPRCTCPDFQSFGACTHAVAPRPASREAAPAGTFLSVDLCPRHGFAMLAVATVDDQGIGGGTRLLGPKSCCADRREVARWRVSADDLERLARELAPAPSESAAEGDRGR